MSNEGKIHLGEYGKKPSRSLVKNYCIKDMGNQKPLDTSEVQYSNAGNWDVIRCGQ